MIGRKQERQRLNDLSASKKQNSYLLNGGNITKVLRELERSSFIAEIIPFGKKKREALYRLVDEYSLFYLTFIEGKRAGKKDIWLQTAQEQSYKIWRGYAFENICMKHVEAIKMALGISGIQTEVSGFRSPADRLPFQNPLPNPTQRLGFHPQITR